MSIVSSVRWVAVSQASRVVSQLVSITVLARLLPSQDYGMMSMAMTVTNLAFLFRDLGTSAAIIRRRELTHRMKCTVYWLNVGIAIVIALILLAAAFPIAHAFGEKRLSGMIMVLAIIFPISSISLVQQALMERESKFRVLARIEVVSAFGGLGLAILLATNGAGIWSLVLQMVFSAILMTVQLLMAAEWRVSRIFFRKEIDSILGFGANLSLFRFVIYLEQNADSMVIGKLLGSAALGVYSMAFKVMLFPIQNLTWVVSRALLPALSRRQGSPQALGALYLRSLGTICIVTAPLMAGVFFLREEFVAIVFGPRWSAVPDVLKWLAPVGFIQSITASTAVAFMALGKSRLMLILEILGCILQVGAFIIGVKWQIEGVAASYFVANLINFLPNFWFAAFVLRIALLEAFLEIVTPVIASCFMLLALYVMQIVIVTLPISMILAFSLKVAVGALAYSFFLLVILRKDISDIRALAKSG